MKKFIDLNNYELKQVFDTNNKLREDTWEAMFEDADFWTDEYINCWDGGIDYSIGWHRGAFFKVTDYDLFIDGLKTAQRTFCMLPYDYDYTIEYVEKLYGKLDYLYMNASCNDYDRVKARVDELIEELEEACFKALMSQYEDCFDYNCQLEHFLEFGVSRVLYDENLYVDDNFELYEMVKY